MEDYNTKGKEPINKSISNGVCASHNQTQLSYCFPCRSLICKECYQQHIEHNVVDTNTAAMQYQHMINQLKYDISNEVELRKKRLESYKLTMENIIEKIVIELESVIEEFKKIIIEEAIEGRSKFYKEVGKLLNELDKEASFIEYKSELNLIENYKESSDPIKVLSINDLEVKLRTKKDKVSNTIQDIKVLEEETHDFINDCERTINNIKSYKKYSRIRLNELQLKRIKEMKQSEELIVEKTHELIELLNKNDQVRREIKVLSEIKYDLKDNVSLLKSHQAQLEHIIRQMTAAVEDLEKSKVLLESYIQDKKNEITNLDLTIKEKGQLIANIKEGILNQNTIQESVTSNFQEQQLLNQSSVIYIFDQKMNKIYIYDFNAKRAISLKAKDYNIFSNHGSVQISNAFYITGGFNAAKVEFSKASLVIYLSNFESIKIERKTDMLIEKTMHKLVMLNMDIIFSLGGKSKDQKLLKMCEKYEIEKDEWKVAPPLNEGRINISAISINSTFIYVFGGLKGSHSCTIELLDTNLEKEGWKIIKLEGNENSKVKESIGCFQLDESKVMIFGGIEEKSGCINKTYIFDFTTKEFKKQKEELVKKEWFANRTTVRLNDGRMCTAGYFSGDIHIFNTNNTWSIIESKLWKN